MTRRELVEAVEGYGFRLSTSPNNDFWDRLLGLGPVGSGNPRDYTEDDLRVIVAWQVVMGLCGQSNGTRGQWPLHREAAYELADHDDGWVVIAEGTVNWTRRPTARVFDRGAVCIPVPSW